MINTVFFNAKNKRIQIRINDKFFGAFSDSNEIASKLKRKGINTLNTTFLHSSDVDFASEEGFSDDSEAHAIIDAAIDTLWVKIMLDFSENSCIMYA